MIEKISRKKFVIIKKIAKHGNQAVIVIPKILESQLKPGTIAQLTIDVFEPAEQKEDKNKNGSWNC